MTVLAIELADSGIVAVTADGPVGDPSPGIALLDGPEPIVGREAADRERLQPRRVHDRFWDRLDTAALGRPYPSNLSAADLAHGHLAAIWSGLGRRFDEATIAVPGTFDQRSLGLLLGLTESIGIPVRRLFDTATVSVWGLPPDPGRYVHVDVLLHCVVLTELEVDRRVVRTRVHRDDRVGFKVLRDLWARAVADRFIRTTRFDPLKLAVTEQRLYNRLPGLVRDLRDRSELEIALATDTKEYEAEVPRTDLLAVSEASCQRIAGLVAENVRDGSRTVVLTDRAALIPGLGAMLRRSGDSPVELERGAAAAAALRLDSPAPDDGDSIPWLQAIGLTPGAAPSDVASTGESVPPDRDGPTPSHIVCGGVAHPLAGEPLVFGVATDPQRRGIDIAGNTAGISRSHCTFTRQGGTVYVEDHSRYGTFLNERPVAGRERVCVGDRLRLGTPGVTLLAITVET